MMGIYQQLQTKQGITSLAQKPYFCAFLFLAHSIYSWQKMGFLPLLLLFVVPLWGNSGLTDAASCGWFF